MRILRIKSYVTYPILDNRISLVHWGSSLIYQFHANKTFEQVTYAIINNIQNCYVCAWTLYRIDLSSMQQKELGHTLNLI